jgi:starch synthase (maltosyl-transferring)
VPVEVRIGAELVRAASRDPHAPRAVADAVAGLAAELEAARDGQVRRLLEDPRLLGPAAEHAPRPHVTVTDELPLVVDVERARFSAWYELFPRSTSPDPARAGTLADVVDRLGYVAELGFDVLYLPPIHPIGRSFRKGPNNATTAGPGDPGSPWAIGSAEGGHLAVHPELGTEDDLRRLVREARARGIDVALDIAFQCSPDHPWVTEHPTWFRWRPDGTVQYAENPPKKYQDIYPLDFESDDWPELWQALRGVFEHWIAAGVWIFRVDNPHTKPFAFWEWLITTVKAEHPEVLFLAEAFTRPKVMHRLAKLGFSQSYTYFAWRDTAHELEEYFTELALEDGREHFRPNVWPNTPDILTEHLQHGGRPAFANRIVLAATLSASYGIYGPAFELVEHEAREPGSEEYRDSEKYQVRHWDLDAPHSLRYLITRLNGIRREHPALQHDRGLAFHRSENPELLCYSKASPDGRDVVLCVVNVDPYHAQSGWITLDLAALHLPGGTTTAHDLLGGGTYTFEDDRLFVILDPWATHAHVLDLGASGGRP